MTYPELLKGGREGAPGWVNPTQQRVKIAYPGGCLPSVGQSVTWGKDVLRAPCIPCSWPWCHPTPVTALSLGCCFGKNPL